MSALDRHFQARQLYGYWPSVLGWSEMVIFVVSDMSVGAADRDALRMAAPATDVSYQAQVVIADRVLRSPLDPVDRSPRFPPRNG